MIETARQKGSFVGLQRMPRVPRTSSRTPGLLVLGVLLALLSGCSSENRDDWKQLAMPDPGAVETEQTLALWQGAWVAALITGLVVWALIFYAVWRFRRRSDDEVPIQTRYNLPLEIFYTVFPVIMVLVFFSHTIRVQNLVLDDSPPDNVIEVVGQKWSWTFNHGQGDPDLDRISGEDGQFAYDSYVYESGTASDIPTLVLPVGVTTRFNLHSPDVIHDFGIPGFLMKLDVIPGRVNHYQLTPKEIGTYGGKCYELCGVSHSRMLFEVEVVSPEDYQAYLDGLAEAGDESDAPLLGGSYARTQIGSEGAPSYGEDAG